MWHVPSVAAPLQAMLAYPKVIKCDSVIRKHFLNDRAIYGVSVFFLKFVLMYINWILRANVSSVFAFFILNWPVLYFLSRLLQDPHLFRRMAADGFLLFNVDKSMPCRTPDCCALLKLSTRKWNQNLKINLWIWLKVLTQWGET